MPIYEYSCQTCGAHVEKMQRITEPALTVCPECGGTLQKLVSLSSFHLKGKGWYVTDYKGKNPSNGNGNEHESDSDGTAEKTEASGSSASTEASSDTKTKTDASPAAKTD